MLSVMRDDMYKDTADDPRLEQGKVDDLNGLDSVVAHLDRYIAEYLRLGVSSSLQLTSGQLLEVIDWARSVNNDVNVEPPQDSELDFFKSGLLEELIQIPSNVFEEVEFPDGQTRYLPMRPEMWEAGLDRFETQLLKTLKKQKMDPQEPLDLSLFDRK
ncbi:MAG: hypothetical protein AAF558_01160 [Verrucomicrobiota bacterium]